MNDLVTRLARFASTTFEALLEAPLRIFQLAAAVVGCACWGAFVGVLAYASLAVLSGSTALGLYGGSLWGVAVFFRKLLAVAFARSGG